MPFPPHPHLGLSAVTAAAWVKGPVTGTVVTAVTSSTGSASASDHESAAGAQAASEGQLLLDEQFSAIVQAQLRHGWYREGPDGEPNLARFRPSTANERARF